MIQNPNTTTQVVQVPTATGTPGVGNGPNQTGQVKFLRVPTGTTRATYNLRPTPSTKVAPVTTTATATATPVAAGRIGVGPQGIQVKQEPSPPRKHSYSQSVLYNSKERKGKESTYSYH